jgi:plastocyanin
MAKRIFAPAAFLFVAFALFASTFGGATAQDSTPAADDDSVARPAHIHSGTCDTLGDVVFPLNDVASADAAAMPAAGNHEHAAQNESTVDVSLDDLLAAEHAINIHESAENIGTYIACGDIAGTVTDGALEIELRELNGSGYAGKATLADGGDGTTTVTIMLMHGDAATPAASPEAAASGEAMVEISEFAYGPATVTIPVGGSITWTNLDSAPHTATAQDREILQSGTLQQGESFTQTFDTPGTYEYFCEFHADMSGTIIVE